MRHSKFICKSNNIPGKISATDIINLTNTHLEHYINVLLMYINCHDRNGCASYELY